MRFLSLLLLLLLVPSAFGAAKLHQAVFAGGCFWCMEQPFDQQQGVVRTTSGFAGGHVANPSYKQVTNGNTGHIEVVEVTYDADLVSYASLLEIYWANVDALDNGGQFCDRGHSYTTAIFYTDEEQAELARKSRALVSDMLGEQAVTDIRPLQAFYPAEAYHQDFYQRNSVKYKYYRWRCGRDARLEELWGENAGKSIELF